MIITVLAFLVTLGILVVIHEYGHYRVALACGVKVLRFSVGFGRVLWRRQSSPDATEFVVAALPLGGYVSMLDEREGPVAESELKHAFNRQPLSRRAAIVIAGVTIAFSEGGGGVRKLAWAGLGIAISRSTSSAGTPAMQP